MLAQYSADSVKTYSYSSDKNPTFWCDFCRQLNVLPFVITVSTEEVERISVWSLDLY